MKKEIRFALFAIKKNIQGSAELRTSFLTNVIGMAINNTAFIVLWVCFVDSVGIINGWTAADIVGLQGFCALSYGIVFSATAGIVRTAEYVASGKFDQFMLSPKNLITRLATASFNASAVGDLVYGTACVVIYCVLIKASLMQIGFICLLIPFSMLLFLAASISINSTSFLFTDAHAVTRGLFEFFMTPTLFHGGAFQGVIRFVFSIIIPSLAVGTLPIEAIKSMSIEKLLLIVAISIIWFLISIKLFKSGVKKYESSNLITFGS